MVTTMLLILLCVMATVAVHRIWNYEDIFAPVRSSFGARLLIDPAWNGLWIAPLIATATLIDHAAVMWVLAVLAAYPLLRGLVFVYERFAPAAAVCTPCQQKKTAFEAHMKDLRSFSKRVIMLGADHEQANWLAQKHPDWVVILFGLGVAPTKLWKNVRYKQVFPAVVSGELTNTVFIGGDATVVSWGVTHTPPWEDAIRANAMMRAVSWVHIGRDVRGLPPHHRVVDVGNPVDHDISQAQPAP